jgi:hypothetical protein
MSQFFSDVGLPFAESRLVELTRHSHRRMGRGTNKPDETRWRSKPAVAADLLLRPALAVFVPLSSIGGASDGMS